MSTLKFLLVVCIATILVAGCERRATVIPVEASAAPPQSDALARTIDSISTLPLDTVADGTHDTIFGSTLDTGFVAPVDSVTHAVPGTPVAVAPAPVTALPVKRVPVTVLPPVAAPPDNAGAPLATAAELSALSAVLAMPVQGVVRAQLRDGYAEARGGRVHEALDIPAPRGTPVLSAADGRLLKKFDSKPGGLMVYASDESERFLLLYGHLDRYADGLTEGMRLTRGQVIGYVGTTGNAQAGIPHLHFAVMRGNPRVAWWKGTPVNPYPLLVPPH